MQATAAEKLKSDLLDYIVSFRPSRDRVFTVREFNSQVMAKTFDTEARESFGSVLADLVARDILQQRTPTDYNLSEHGVAFVRERRGEG